MSFRHLPRGRRSPDGRLYRGKIRSPAWSSAGARHPCCHDRHARRPADRPEDPPAHPIGMVIGEPSISSRCGLHSDRYVLRAITDEIMYNLMLLSGQEYVDLYAADVKAQLAAEGAPEGLVLQRRTAWRTHGSRRACADRSRRRNVGGGEQHSGHVRGRCFSIVPWDGRPWRKRDTGRVEWTVPCSRKWVHALAASSAARVSRSAYLRQCT